MITGDVNDFLARMDFNEWEVLYKGYGYFLQMNYHPDRDTFQINIMRRKAHTNDHTSLIYDRDKNGHHIDASYIDLPAFKTYKEAIDDFVKEKI